MKPAPPKIRPWRATLWDARTGDEVEPDELAEILLDLVYRDRELLRALELNGFADDAPDVQRFRQVESALLQELAGIRCGGTEDLDPPDVVRRTDEVVQALTDLRHRILAGCEADQLRKILASESRVRAPEFEIRQELAALTLALAEERGDFIEIELPLAQAQDDGPSPRQAVVRPRELRERIPALLEMEQETQSKADPGASELRPELVEMLETAFPDGYVDMPYSEESYLADVYPRLRRMLARIPGAHLAWERDPDGGPGWHVPPVWYDNDDDVSDWEDSLSYSYYLFFLAPDGEAFEFETSEETRDEDAVERRVDGRGRRGLSVAISMIAPVAIVEPNDMVQFEDGSSMDPDILHGELPAEDGRDRGEPPNAAVLALDALRGHVVKTLGSRGIEVLPRAELAQPVPWLVPGEDAFLDATEEPITVREAFFFCGP